MRKMNRRNYQRELEGILAKIREEGKKPSLLLHSCCAPCSSYVLEYLSPYFQITDFYYNPNITPEEEYVKRQEELARLIRQMDLDGSVTLVTAPYDSSVFFEAIKGLEKEPEGGARCSVCYELRMRESAREAAARGCDFFTTTLSISPLKDADRINAIGEKLEKEYGVRHLPSDFKKKNGYLRSTLLSREYDLYRQNYCGCVFSKGHVEK